MSSSARYCPPGSPACRRGRVVRIGEDKGRESRSVVGRSGSFDQVDGAAIEEHDRTGRVSSTERSKVVPEDRLSVACAMLRARARFDPHRVGSAARGAAPQARLDRDVQWPVLALCSILPSRFSATTERVSHRRGPSR